MRDYDTYRQEIVKLCDLCEGQLRDDYQFAELESGGDDLFAELG